ncbi:MAG: FecR family protein, partial [Planctomycetaceae bacterium]
RSTPWAVAAAAVLVLALNQRAARESAVWSPTEIVTGATELATVRLEDGSVVRLAPSSRLQVHGGAERDVTLEGRAYFAVTKDDSRPFRVRTAAGTAQVLGTRFEIATDAEGLRLFVLEGRVALDAPANRVEVGAGEQSGVRNGAATLPARFADAENAAAWLGKFLAFQATPLREAAREIERLYEVNVLVADSALAVTTITATFTDRPLQAVTDVVCLILSARCSTKQDTVIISR